MAALAPWYKLPPLRIQLTYRRKVAVIKLRMHRRIFAAEIAAKLCKLAFKLSPGFAKAYDDKVIEAFLASDPWD